MLASISEHVLTNTHLELMKYLNFNIFLLPLHHMIVSSNHLGLKGLKLPTVGVDNTMWIK